MEFASPIWLFALAPWTAFALWLFWGRRRRTWVPYLPLWDVPEELKKPREKSLQPPPLAVVLAVLAMLAGILSVAGPRVVLRQAAPGLTIVVDRGASMSALVEGEARFAVTAREAATEVREILGPGPARIIELPGNHTIESNRADWPASVKSLKRTAADTRDGLAATVALLVERRTPAIVISDGVAPSAARTLVRIGPGRGVRNAGIILVAADKGQVMARVLGNYDGSRTLRVSSGSAISGASVEFKAGESRDVFVDLPNAGAVIGAHLEGADDFDGDDRAWLAKSRSWPQVELRAGIQEELGRMIGVYGRHRQADPSSPRLAIGRSDQIKGDEAGVELEPIAGAEAPVEAVNLPAAHPVTAHVNWSEVSKSASIAQQGPGEGWTILARSGARPIIAVREIDAHTRRVWIGFWSESLGRSADFVVFWTNVLDWVGGGDDAYRARRVGEIPSGNKRVEPAELRADIDGGMWPGVFEESGFVAVNAGPVSFGAGGADWRTALAEMKMSGMAEQGLSPYLSVAALLLLLGAAATWEKERLRAPANSILA